jgi:hypothetical protein
VSVFGSRCSKTKIAVAGLKSSKGELLQDMAGSIFSAEMGFSALKPTKTSVSTGKGEGLRGPTRGSFWLGPSGKSPKVRFCGIMFGSFLLTTRTSTPLNGGLRLVHGEPFRDQFRTNRAVMLI